MNRVWKKFFKKISVGLLAIAYVILILIIPAFISAWLDYNPMAGITIGLFAFLILPLVSYMMWDTYQESKREVEWENKRMMAALRGDD